MDKCLEEWNVTNNNLKNSYLKERKKKYKMSGILYLNVDDFVVRKGEKGNLMCLNYDVQGLSLVLFYSNECHHCNKLLVKYKQLPLNINGCQFTMINVNKMENRRVVQMSNQTIVPITYVPDVILYVDGVPYMRYDGSHDIPSIKTFILDIYQRLQKTAFLDAKRSQPPSSQEGQVHRGVLPNNTRQTSNRVDVVPQQNVSVQSPSSVSNTGATNRSNSTIPAYTIGKPKCSGERDDVCYVTFNEAYRNVNQSKTSSENHRQSPSPVFYQQQVQ